MFALAPYAAYAETGLPWCPRVPAHWNLARNKSVMTRKAEPVGSGWDTHKLLSLTKQGVIVRDLSSGKGKMPASFDSYQRIEAGDIVMCLFDVDETPRTVGISRDAGMITGAYDRFLVANKMTAEFLAWFYIAIDNVKGLRPLYRGLRKTIPCDEFLGSKIALPPADEQAGIVRYLAHANARIGKAIAAKRHLIALLDEYFAAALNDLLQPGQTEIEHVSIGQTSTLVQTGPFGSQLHSEEYIEGGTPVLNPSHLTGQGIVPDMTVSVSSTKTEDLARHRLCIGDVIAARRGDLGRCDVVTDREAGWLCGTGSLIVRLRRDRWVPEYFQLLFSSRRNKERLQLGSVGSTMANLNAAQVSRLRLARPTIDAQSAVVDAALCLRESHNQRVSTIQREIDLLREFRTRLIADVVTGQVDVQDVARSLAEVDKTSSRGDSSIADDIEPARIGDVIEASEDRRCG